MNDAGNLVDVPFAAGPIPDGASISCRKSIYARRPAASGPFGYVEPRDYEIKNTVNSMFDDPFAEFEDQTFISKIGLFDEDKNLIGVAKLATPVRKTRKRELTFKLKIDL